MANKKQINLKRLLRGFAIVLLLGAVTLYLILPAAFGVFVVLPGRQTVGAAPQGFETVTLRTADQVNLQAWFRPPENGAAIILTQGAGGSRESLRPYAAMLAQHGYGVLALDLRGHGASEGKTNRLGWQGTSDVGAAVDYLRLHPEVNSIGGLGISMGGEVLLGVASTYPEISAIAVDGATRRSVAELLALESERPLVRNITARVMYATVQLLSGEKPPEPLLDAINAAPATKFLFIAAGENQLEVQFNQLFTSVLDGRASLWVASGVEHTGAFAQYPQEYERRVVGFFNKTLLMDSE